MIESLYYLVQLLFILPLLFIVTNNINNVFVMLMADYVMVVVLAIFSAVTAKRSRILLSLPYFYVLRFLELGVFVWAFIEVIILRKFSSTQRGWSTEGRRYELSSESVEGL
jgi:hypothetical protein